MKYNKRVSVNSLWINAGSLIPEQLFLMLFFPCASTPDVLSVCTSAHVFLMCNSDTDIYQSGRVNLNIFTALIRVNMKLRCH